MQSERFNTSEVLTMRGVARLAGVSTATVSRTLNSPHVVSEETRKRILSIVLQHRFSINQDARNLSTSKPRRRPMSATNDTHV